MRALDLAQKSIAIGSSIKCRKVRVSGRRAHFSGAGFFATSETYAIVGTEGKEKAIKIELPDTLPVQGPGSERYDRHGPDG
jgi:hypothetical protein